MTKYWLAGGFLAVLLAGCSPEQAENAETVETAMSSSLAAAQDKATSYGPDSWKSIIPESCAHFFDGCNTCTRAPDAKMAVCTRKACMAYKEPKCLDEKTTGSDFQQADYTCEGGETFKVFRGEYRGGDMRVKLKADEIWLSDTQTRTAHRMQRVPSASGEKYADGGISFWAKGSEAMVQKGEETIYRACKVNS